MLFVLGLDDVMTEVAAAYDVQIATPGLANLIKILQEVSLVLFVFLVKVFSENGDGRGVFGVSAEGFTESGDRGRFW